jgi:dTDP-4-dehydrorhamnose reductase
MLGTALVPMLGEAHEVDGMGIEDGDVCNRSFLRKRIDAFRPDALVHLAAMTAVDRCETEEDEAFRLNGEGSRVAATEAERLGVPILAVSTDYVFDGQKSSPYSEDDPTGPQSVYGRSKLAGEEAVKAASLAWTIVRSAWLYGTGGPNFVDTIIERLRTQKTVSVVDDQTGSPTYALDLALGIRTLLEAHARGVFHVVNAGRASWFELAREIARQTGLDVDRVIPASTAELGRKAPRPTYSVLSSERARARHGIELRSWPEALEAYIAQRDVA